ncbi:MAG: hypothetical protein MSS80_00140, partial [Mollicutes bacterium]|nr:hypothetical protein [Mollicutes bacterium]MDY2724266.1 hypothetical protein [Candidatus Onthovivens sp.]MDY4544786.1 hypothetical protein [Bacilli bacterium]
LSLEDGRNVPIESIETNTYNHYVNVYNFKVDDFHTYYVSDISVLTHNESGCPNPNGKNGGIKHQSKINEIVAEAQKRGLKYIKEYRFKTPNGYKKNRYADVVILDSKNRVMEIHQVGRTTKKHKKPVSRERKAIRDIRKSNDYNGAKIFYHPYDC